MHSDAGLAGRRAGGLWRSGVPVAPIIVISSLSCVLKVDPIVAEYIAVPRFEAGAPDAAVAFVKSWET